MSRENLIKEIWKYGMNNPSFPIVDLKKHLENCNKKKRKKYRYSEDDINFGLAYVRTNYYKNQNTDEYLIDQDSISNYISLKQNQIAQKSWRVSLLALIVSSFSFAVASLSSLPAFIEWFSSYVENSRTKETTVPREEFNQEDSCQDVIVFPDSLAR